MKRAAFSLMTVAALALGVHSANAQPVRACPEGQAVNSLNPNGTAVNCVPLPAPVDLAPLQTALAAEAAARQGMDATLLGAINAETEARKAAVQSLQDSLASPATRCYAAHFVRSGGSEMRFTVFTFSNGDTQNPATIERITFRGPHGNVLSDTGPKVGVPHPLAGAPVPPRDITIVPPGGSYFLATSDLWGFNPIPEVPGTDIISVQVEVSKAGKRSLFQVSARESARDRIQTGPTNFATGAERAANSAPCFAVDPM
jgi:hypothetical protein